MNYQVITTGKTLFEIHPQLTGVFVNVFHDNLLVGHISMDSEKEAISFIENKWISLN